MEPQGVHVLLKHLHIFIDQRVLCTHRKHQITQFALRPLFLANLPEILVGIQELFQSAGIIQNVLHAVVGGVKNGIGIIGAELAVIHRAG